MIVSQSGSYEMCLSPPYVQQREQQGLQSERDVLLPGFRFHPTDEELVGYYLRRMVMNRPLQGWITQVDIYKFDPWDLPKMAVGKGEREWYFFCPRDRKYRNSARPNRVTSSGFWKATGTDRPIYSRDATNCIGLKKSLVFYKGRAPKGIKTDWMMHEFRLPPSNDASSNVNKLLSEESCPLQQDAWAVCRIFKKSTLGQRHGSACQQWDIMEHEKMVAESVGRGLTYQAQAECSSAVDLELDSSSPDLSESSWDDLELDQVERVCGSMMHSKQQQNINSRQDRQLSRSTWPPSIQKVNSFGDLFDSAAARGSNVLYQRSNTTDSVYPATGTVDPFFSEDSLAVRGALDFVNSTLNSPRSEPQLMSSMVSNRGVYDICSSVPGPSVTTPATEKFRKKLSVQIPQGPLAQPSCGLQPWDIISPIFPLECM